MFKNFVSNYKRGGKRFNYRNNYKITICDKNTGNTKNTKGALNNGNTENASNSKIIPDDKKKENYNPIQPASTGKSVEITLPPVKQHLIDVKLPEKTILTREDGIKYLTDMITARQLEDVISNLYLQKLARGFCHVYSGQEAVAIGIKQIKQPNDCAITGYRQHVWCWTMGISLKNIVAEMAQKKSGISKGKGGSMHMYAKNYFGGNGIVGAQVPLGTGVTFANKYKNVKDCITYIIFGDGCSLQGQVYEATNMATLWKLPAIYICENNKYGMGTEYSRASTTPIFSKFNYLPAIQVDGMNILMVREVAKFARDYALKNGPILIEALTYRYTGHSMSDPGVSYRTREEVQKVRETKDPIVNLQRIMIEHKLSDEDEIKQIKKQIQTELHKIRDEILKEKEPPAEDLMKDIYSGTIKSATIFSNIK